MARHSGDGKNTVEGHVAMGTMALRAIVPRTVPVVGLV
jgi:hypothetical protein